MGGQGKEGLKAALVGHEGLDRQEGGGGAH